MLLYVKKRTVNVEQNIWGRHMGCIRLEIQQVQQAILKKTLSIEPLVKNIDSTIEKSIDELSIFRELIINQLKQKYEYALQTKIEKDFIFSLKNKLTQEINCSFMWNLNKSLMEQRKQTIKIQDHLSNFEKIWNQFHNQITELKRNAFHSFKLHKKQFFDKQQNLIIDSNGQIRIMIKKDNVITTDFKGTLTEDDVQKMNILDIGWSDNPQTMDTPESWYINNVNFTTNTNLLILKVISNVFNGKTSTGEDWTNKYEGGLLCYKGVVRTYGHFSSFYMGWKWKQHVKIGTFTSLRSGGHPSHTGQWIHSSCNGYADKQHSITSRIGWKNTRVFWVRIA